MTNKDQNVDAVKESEGSIGFLRASEKMWISTFEVPLTFLEDLGFSKERTQAAKDFNQKFISGFYGRVRSIGEKMSGGGKKAKPAQAAKASKEKTSTKAKPAKQKDTASNATSRKRA
ncbi:MAG: hypothetical protein JSV45_00270 [Chromatiales bacterium]|nr:MAG: hypothetical protein JSV45_00270 [Chromatiales bacterium]